MPIQIRILPSVALVPETEWNSLAGENPALAHAYLLALEETGCASPRKGWQTQFLAAFDADRLIGAMPLYFKSHSYGEFVFDWAWAEAYQQNGLRYYAKLVCSIPFTPVSGARILSASPEVRILLAQAALRLAQESGASSLHCLFPNESQAQELAGQGMMLRQAIQFHWQNMNYGSFDDFLASMRHDKRKKILQERRKLKEAGLTFERVLGEKVTAQDWHFFMSATWKPTGSINHPYR